MIYALLCKLWPLQVYPPDHQSESKSWETMVPTEGFFHDDETTPAYIKDRVLLGEEPAQPSAVEEQEQVMRKKE